MTSTDFVNQLTEFYHGKYSETLMRELLRFVDGIPEAERQRVLTWTFENRERMSVCGVFDVRASCFGCGVSFRATQFIPAEDWTCDACGQGFRYAPAVSDDDKIDKGIHALCPRCGYPPSSTKLARGYKAIGRDPEWYPRELAECRERVETRGRPYWERAVAERERREGRLVGCNGEVRKVFDAKAWIYGRRGA